MDFEQYVLLGAVIAGITELLSRARAKDWWVVATIVTAVVTGAAFGLAEYYPGMDVVEGIAAGFGLCGALKAFSMFGNKSTPAPSDVVAK